MIMKKRLKKKLKKRHNLWKYRNYKIICALKEFIDKETSKRKFIFADSEAVSSELFTILNTQRKLLHDNGGKDEKEA